MIQEKTLTISSHQAIKFPTNSSFPAETEATAVKKRRWFDNNYILKPEPEKKYMSLPFISSFPFTGKLLLFKYLTNSFTVLSCNTRPRG